MLNAAVDDPRTSARRLDRDELFRAAHGGTLFLDEVGEAPPEVQVMLLQVLEAGEIYPVGAEKPVAIHVRLIAITDANLEDQIRHGQFKAPLLHRLAGFEVRIPRCASAATTSVSCFIASRARSWKRSARPTGCRRRTPTLGRGCPAHRGPAGALPLGPATSASCATYADR